MSENKEKGIILPHVKYYLKCNSARIFIKIKLLPPKHDSYTIEQTCLKRILHVFTDCLVEKLIQDGK